MFEALANYINMFWVYFVLIAVYIITIIGTIGVIVSENRSPVKSLAWVTVLLLLPILGFILYLFFGRSIKNTRMISRRNRRKLRRKETFQKLKLSNLGLSIESLQQIHLARTLSGAIYYPGNKVEIYSYGKEKMEMLLHDLRNAKEYINIQYYIISDDKIGKQLQEILIDRAKNGVTVRVIYDNVGSFRTANKYFKEMNQAGIKAYPFFKVAFPPFGTRINWRNHRKICVIDGKIGYIGGMNIADRYIDGGKSFQSWRDTHIRIVGPAVAALQYSFAVDWNFMGQPLIEEHKLVKEQIPIHKEGAGLQLLTSGPTSQWNNISMLFIKAIANAKRRVYIQTPYFLPTEGLLKALQTASLSGVDVRVMLPMKSDSLMLDYASGSYISECLQAGIKIYMFQEGMLHSKVVLTDDEFVSIGSTNFDFRSFEHNFEANMQIYSHEINYKMREIMKEDFMKSIRLSLREWKKRPIGRKTAESLTRLLSPIL